MWTVGKDRRKGKWSTRQVEQLTGSFLPMVLLWERERVMLKNDSFLVAERGGDEVLTSLPLEGGRGGDAVGCPRAPDRLSMLGEELTVLELCPERDRERSKDVDQMLMQRACG